MFRDKPNLLRGAQRKIRRSENCDSSLSSSSDLRYRSFLHRDYKYLAEVNITVAKLSCTCRLIMKNRLSTKLAGGGTSLGATHRKRLERKHNDKKLSWSVKRIGADMVEISEGQKRIREGQKEIRKRIQEIIEEGAKLKEETNAISKQSSENQLRLDLMFQIVKARAEKDYAKDALLTQTLRFVILKISVSCV
uniref:Uncharacterized protein n=1 Tax=Salix viminalis TaxID=40686 RepID=A0A6N2NEF4_SALVM